MSDIQLESRKVKKKCLKTHFMDFGYIDVLSTSQGRPDTDAFLVLHIGPYGDVLRMSGRFLGTSSGRPWDIILPSG